MSDYLSKRWGKIAKDRLKGQKGKKWFKIFGKKSNIVDNWLESEMIEREYIRPNVSGNKDSWWLTYVKNIYIPNKLSHGLSLGCSDGYS